MMMAVECINLIGKYRKEVGCLFENNYDAASYLS
jgi:hypothetical protein